MYRLPVANAGTWEKRPLSLQDGLTSWSQLGHRRAAVWDITALQIASKDVATTTDDHVDPDAHDFDFDLD